LNLFEFDYDLTFMVFFLNADEKVYARYGGRDAKDADNRQSLKGLHYTMQSVLEMHEREDKSFAPRSQKGRRTVRDLASATGERGRFGRGCVHCHQVRERQNAELRSQGKWERDLVWRYPLPENVGLILELDRGNVIKQVKDKSAASVVGLKAGDVVRRLNGVPIHSFADAQFALDIAPRTGTIDVVWEHGSKIGKEKLTLADGWRKSDVAWRPSLRNLVPAARLYGVDLTDAEKKALGLPAERLAFRQKDGVPAQARAAGIRGGDIILGLDDKPLAMDVDDFLRYVRHNYLVGDKVTVNIIRDGKRLNLAMTLLR
jgi:S1-C subfamily serine protease